MLQNSFFVLYFHFGKTNSSLFLYLAQRSKATSADAPGLRKDDRLEEKNLIKIIYRRRTDRQTITLVGGDKDYGKQIWWGLVRERRRKTDKRWGWMRWTFEWETKLYVQRIFGYAKFHSTASHFGHFVERDYNGLNRLKFNRTLLSARPRFVSCFMHRVWEIVNKE